MKFSTSVVLIFLFLSSISLQAQFNRKAALDARIKEISKNNPLPSFIVGGVDKNGILYQYPSGSKIWGKTEPINIHHIFRIASMTKAITSVAAMQLVEQGKLTLDEPLDNLMPEMASIPILNKDGNVVKASGSITLRHLLTHTAGFGYTFLHDRLDKFSKNKTSNYTIPYLPRVFESGSSWQYGTNTDWVGKIVEKVSGMSLENYVQTYISKPLGMRRTFFSVPDSLVSEITSIGQLVDGKFVADTLGIYKDLKTTKYNGGGGLFSTFYDYAQFIRCILNDGTLNKHQILKKNTLDLMFENQIGELLTVIKEPSSAYPFLVSDTFTFVSPGKFGLGWAIDHQGRAHIREPGTVYWGGIQNTYFSIDRKKGQAVMFFSNNLPFGNPFVEDIYYKAEGAIYQVK